MGLLERVGLSQADGEAREGGAEDFDFGFEGFDAGGERVGGIVAR